MKRSTVKTDLMCLICGSVFPISRRVKRQKSEFHIKDLYCYKCKKETKFVELKDYSTIKKKLELKPNKDEFEKHIYDLLCKDDEIKLNEEYRLSKKIL